MICRCGPNRFKVVEFSQDCSLGYNVELLNRAANSSPESGQIEKIDSCTTIERTILYIKEFHPFSMQYFSVSTFTYAEKFLMALLSTLIALKVTALESIFQTA